MRISSIQFKAVFLLIVFSLSTIVGFACSVGSSMAFNADHHKEPAGHKQKGHEHGNSHDHEASSNHHQNSANHHQEQADPHKQVNNPQENPMDNCCKDEVAKFEKSDKRTPQSFKYNIQPLFVTLTFNTPFNLDAIASNIHLPSNKYFVRNHHPPIADTRIAIQSFLI